MGEALLMPGPVSTNKACARKSSICLRTRSFTYTSQNPRTRSTTASNPSYQIRKIDPQAIGWHRVYKRRQKKTSKHDTLPLANATAEHQEEERPGGEEDESMFEYEYVDDESISFLESLWEEKRAAAAAAAATVRAEAAAAEDPSTLLGPYMVFLLTAFSSDPFSLHLETLINQLAPAFPHVLFLKGDGQQDFSGLTSQIRVKGLPQLLIFEENLLRSRYKAKTKDLKSVLNFLVLHTGALPQAVVGKGGRGGGERRFVVRLPRGAGGEREGMSVWGGMGWLYWISALYVLGEWSGDRWMRRGKRVGKESPSTRN